MEADRDRVHSKRQGWPPLACKRPGDQYEADHGDGDCCLAAAPELGEARTAHIADWQRQRRQDRGFLEGDANADEQRPAQRGSGISVDRSRSHEHQNNERLVPPVLVNALPPRVPAHFVALRAAQLGGVLLLGGVSSRRQVNAGP